MGEKDIHSYTTIDTSLEVSVQYALKIKSCNAWENEKNSLLKTPTKEMGKKTFMPYFFFV